jgi:hypothetical protein
MTLEYIIAAQPRTSRRHLPGLPVASGGAAASGVGCRAGPGFVSAEVVLTPRIDVSIRRRTTSFAICEPIREMAGGFGSRLALRMGRCGGRFPNGLAFSPDECGRIRTCDLLQNGTLATLTDRARADPTGPAPGAPMA